MRSRRGGPGMPPSFLRTHPRRPGCWGGRPPGPSTTSVQTVGVGRAPIPTGTEETHLPPDRFPEDALRVVLHPVHRPGEGMPETPRDPELENEEKNDDE